jgi:hypothetical protein
VAEEVAGNSAVVTEVSVLRRAPLGTPKQAPARVVCELVAVGQRKSPRNFVSSVLGQQEGRGWAEGQVPMLLAVLCVVVSGEQDFCSQQMA